MRTDEWLYSCFGSKFDFLKPVEGGVECVFEFEKSLPEELDFWILKMKNARYLKILIEQLELEKVKNIKGNQSASFFSWEKNARKQFSLEFEKVIFSHGQQRWVKFPKCQSLGHLRESLKILTYAVNDEPQKIQIFSLVIKKSQSNWFRKWNPWESNF